MSSLGHCVEGRVLEGQTQIGSAGRTDVRALVRGLQRGRLGSREGAGVQGLRQLAYRCVPRQHGDVQTGAWKEIGVDAAAESVRKTIGFLLYGPKTLPLKDRLTQIIRGQNAFGMTGFKEALLAKLLCVVYPERFLSILMYTGTAGKREVAGAVYGLELPNPHNATWMIGRLILWSNDVLHHLVADEFVDQQHVAQLLWWAKDQPGGLSA